MIATAKGLALIVVGGMLFLFSVATLALALDGTGPHVTWVNRAALIGISIANSVLLTLCAHTAGLGVSAKEAEIDERILAKQNENWAARNG